MCYNCIVFGGVPESLKKEFERAAGSAYISARCYRETTVLPDGRIGIGFPHWIQSADRS